MGRCIGSVVFSAYYERLTAVYTDFFCQRVYGNLQTIRLNLMNSFINFQIFHDVEYENNDVKIPENGRREMMELFKKEIISGRTLSINHIKCAVKEKVCTMQHANGEGYVPERGDRERVTIQSQISD